MANENQCGFAKAVNEYLATHPVKGLADWGDFQKYAATPAVKGAVDATVQPCHKARKIRFWGALEHMSVFKSWGLDVAEFDPDAADRGDYPDVIFCHLAPGYCQGDVDQALAKRLGHTYGGVLNVSSAKDAVYFANCPRLLAGFPEGRLDAGAYPILRTHACAVYMTGERCLLGVADTKQKRMRTHACAVYMTGERCLLGVTDMKQKRIASAIAQYPYGKGAATFVCPFASFKKEELNDPAYKRLLLNLITLLPPVGGKACTAC